MYTPLTVPIVTLDYFFFTSSGRSANLTLPSFLCFLTFHSNVAACYMTRHGVLQDLERITVYRSLNETQSGLNIHALASREDVQNWIGNGFIPRTNGAVIQTYNRLAGSVAISQTRTKSAVCDVDQNLRDFYAAQCYPIVHPLDVTPPGVHNLGKEFVIGGGLREGAPTRFYAWINFFDETNLRLIARPGTTAAESIETQARTKVKDTHENIEAQSRTRPRTN